MDHSPSAVAGAAAAALLLAACSADEECAPSASTAGSCPDLLFRSQDYVEWREVDPPRLPQEVGNATYPACNAAENCESDQFEGFRGTDVWLLDGVELTDAVMGLRQGTHTYVIFVRVGVDPDELSLGVGTRVSETVSG